MYETFFAENLKRERVRRGLSGKVLAEKAGMSSPYLTQLEKGVRKPSPALLQKLAHALSIPIETLLAPASPASYNRPMTVREKPVPYDASPCAACAAKDAEIERLKNQVDILLQGMDRIVLHLSTITGKPAPQKER